MPLAFFVLVFGLAERGHASDVAARSMVFNQHLWQPQVNNSFNDDRP